MSNDTTSINITLHHDNFRLTCGALTAQLTPKDFAILHSFKQSKSETMSRQLLIQSHFPQSNGNSEQLLNNAIYRMRLGLRTVTELENPMITVHRKGYKLHKAIALHDDEFIPSKSSDNRYLMLASLTSVSLIFALLMMSVILNLTADTTPKPLEPQSALPSGNILLLQQRSAPQISPSGEHLTYVGVDQQGHQHLYQHSLQNPSAPLPIPITRPINHTASTQKNNISIALTTSSPFSAELLPNIVDSQPQYSAGMWSPNNTHIAYTVYFTNDHPTKEQPIKPQCRLKIYSLDSHIELDVGPCAHPEGQLLKHTTAWSPDSKRLYFVSTSPIQIMAALANQPPNIAQVENSNNTSLAYYSLNTQQIVPVETQLPALLPIAQPTIMSESQIALAITDTKGEMRVAIHDLHSGLTSVSFYGFRQIRGMTYLPGSKQLLLSGQLHSQFYLYALQLPTNVFNPLLILSSHDLVEPSADKQALYFAEEQPLYHNVIMNRQGKRHRPLLDSLNTGLSGYTQPLLTRRAVFFHYQLAKQWHLGYVQHNHPDIVTNIATDNRVKRLSAIRGFAVSPNGNNVVFVDQTNNSPEKLMLFNLDTRENTPLLTANQTLWRFHHPFWSQCDNAILFSAAHSPHHHQMENLSAGNDNPNQSTQTQYRDMPPVNDQSHSQSHHNDRLYGWQYQLDSQQWHLLLDSPASKIVASDDCRYLAYSNQHSDGLALYDREQRRTITDWPHLKKQHYQLVSQFNNSLYWVADYQGEYALYHSQFAPFKPEKLYSLSLPKRFTPHSLQVLDHDKILLSYSTIKSDLQKILLEDLY